MFINSSVWKATIFFYNKTKPLKEKRSKREVSNNRNVSNGKREKTMNAISNETNEKTAELNPIFIQSLLKESKLKVIHFSKRF